MDGVLGEYSEDDGVRVAQRQAASVNMGIPCHSGSDSEATPLLPAPNVALQKPQPTTSRYAAARGWMSRLWRRVSSPSVSRSSSPPPTPVSNSRTPSKGECECGQPKSEPLFRRLRRMGSRADSTRLSRSASADPSAELASLRKRLK